MTDFTAARKHMVDSQIAPSGVSDAAILDSFLATPREVFVPQALQGICYRDSDLEITKGRYLLSPMVQAKLLQAAQVKPSDVVLDVGCMTGYSSAILSPLVTTVFAVDDDEALLSKAERFWKDVGAYNIVSSRGVLGEGIKDEPQYDLIIINGAVASVPGVFVQKLAQCGRLITILKESPHQVGRAVSITRNSTGGHSVRILFDANTAYMRGFEPVRKFAF